MKKNLAGVAVMGFASLLCAVSLLTFSHMTFANPYFNYATLHYPYILAY